MPTTRTQLLIRKGDLLAALRTLDQDHAEGVIDNEAYKAARNRYEQEAADVLRRLDALPADHPPIEPAPDRVTPLLFAARAPWLLAGGAGLLVAAAFALFLITSLHSSGNKATATASKPPSPRIVAAQRNVLSHPRSVTALVALGNAYLEDGQAASADATYRTAMKLDPNAPQPPTLHAFIIGYAGQTSQALALLHHVEQHHPSFSRAWLLDGVFSAHGPKGSPGYKRAILAWQRFLALEPKSPLTTQVRSWIAGAQKALRTKK